MMEPRKPRTHHHHEPPTPTLEQQLVRLCDKKLTVSPSTTQTESWIIRTDIQSIIETIREFCSRKVATELIADEKRVELFSAQFFECVKKLPTKQGNYAYLLFAMSKNDGLKSCSNNILKKFISEFGNGGKVEFREFKNKMRFLAELSNLTMVSKACVKTIFEELVKGVVGERSESKDYLAIALLIAVNYLRDEEVRKSVGSVLKTYCEKKREINKGKIIESNNESYLDFLMRGYLQCNEEQCTNKLFEYGKFENLKEKMEADEIPVIVLPELVGKDIVFAEILKEEGTLNNEPKKMEEEPPKNEQLQSNNEKKEQPTNGDTESKEVLTNNMEIITEKSVKVGFEKYLLIDGMIDCVFAYYSDSPLLLQSLQTMSVDKVNYNDMCNVLFSIYLSGVLKMGKMLLTSFSQVLLYMSEMFMPITKTEFEIFGNIEDYTINAINLFSRYFSMKYIHMNLEFSDVFWRKVDERIKKGKKSDYLWTLFFNDLSLFDARRIQSDMLDQKYLVEKVKTKGRKTFSVDEKEKNLYDIISEEINNGVKLSEVEEKVKSVVNEDVTPEVLMKYVLNNYTSKIGDFDKFVEKNASEIKEKFFKEKFVFFDLIDEMNAECPFETVIEIKRLIHYNVANLGDVFEWVCGKVSKCTEGIHYVELMIYITQLDGSVKNTIIKAFEDEETKHTDQFEKDVIVGDKEFYCNSL
ncbi:hypothetical protein EIN_391410 [Entamoeba invadens IP1]|uniref:MIF4G domain-containing protein n=1 Tax=Entamoeba invadens IP1 TaxID=370355 RepID=A0A0A1UBA7_ENTIV|nr:hypothetical protein EIN_391410 [Entamoeba invadens IP1]ELP89486.1 hypothetical protein EIN_391410 [Entamoeba invadens IP1]|eukprot:XP_004256257.1 hypothetical protein EIN_391410 [Entamoeba invadens IP1]